MILTPDKTTLFFFLHYLSCFLLCGKERGRTEGRVLICFHNPNLRFGIDWCGVPANTSALGWLNERSLNKHISPSNGIKARIRFPTLPHLDSCCLFRWRRPPRGHWKSQLFVHPSTVQLQAPLPREGREVSIPEDIQEWSAKEVKQPLLTSDWDLTSWLALSWVKDGAGGTQRCCQPQRLSVWCHAGEGSCVFLWKSSHVSNSVLTGTAPV